MNDPRHEEFEPRGPDARTNRRPGAGNAGAPNLADLPEKLLNLLRQSPVAEIEQNIKSVISSTISKLDLVTREEFDIQAAMIERLRDRIEILEANAKNQEK